jgi:hypothetical protein
VELDVGTELEAAEWRGGPGVELVGDTGLGRDRGRSRRMEHGHDGRHKSKSKLASA